MTRKYKKEKKIFLAIEQKFLASDMCLNSRVIISPFRVICFLYFIFIPSYTSTTGMNVAESDTKKGIARK